MVAEKNIDIDFGNNGRKFLNNNILKINKLCKYIHRVLRVFESHG